MQRSGLLFGQLRLPRGAAEDCLSAQEGHERRHVVVAASSSKSCLAGSQEDTAEDCLSAQERARATVHRSRRVALHGFKVHAKEWAPLRAAPAAKGMRLRTASVRRRGTSDGTS